MKTIYLCGFMGCGKSTVGRILAKRLKCSFIDLDDYIEKQEGMSIPEIFGKKGEAYFRQLETDALRELSGIGGVVATGGGTLLSEENGSLAKEIGFVAFIDTEFYTCYNRIKDDPHRPIAASSTKEQLRERYDQRKPLYCAHSHIAVSGGYPPIVIAVKIERKYRQQEKQSQ